MFRKKYILLNNNSRKLKKAILFDSNQNDMGG